LIKEKIIEKIDHRNINLEVDFMQGKFASTETLCIAVWSELEESIRNLGAELHCVKIFESENNFVEYYG
jgi:6-pyruvoyltetrahydropterin/6-carboxytetrahydropterin synthase